MPKCFCKPFKLWGFWSHMWSIFVNFQKMPKLWKITSKVCSACVLLVNGAQHSPLLSLEVGPKGNFPGSTQMCCSKISQSHMWLVWCFLSKFNISSNILSIWSSRFMQPKCQNAFVSLSNFGVFGPTCGQFLTIFRKYPNFEKSLLRCALRAFCL